MKIKMFFGNEFGFTLVELLIIIFLMSALALGAVLLLNPASWLASSRNNERKSHVNVILNAVSEDILDNKGVFSCASGALPTTSTRITSDVSGYNLVFCISSYLQKAPYDPGSLSGAYFNDESDYDLGYDIWINSTSGVVRVEAPFSELGEDIFAER